MFIFSLQHAALLDHAVMAVITSSVTAIVAATLALM